MVAVESLHRATVQPRATGRPAGILPGMAPPARRPARTGGRRANYAPPPQAEGVRKYRPEGWANWLGTIMFSLIAIALVVEIITAVADGRGADPIAATILLAAFCWMIYLFATTRFED